MPLSTAKPVGTVGGHSGVRSGGHVLRRARDVAPGRRVDAIARVGVREAPGAAVLERVRPVARPPPAVGQVHGPHGGRDPRGPFHQLGRGQRIAVPAAHHVGHGHPEPEGAAVLLLRVQPPDRVAQTVGDRSQRAGLAGAGQADPVQFGYV